MVYRLYLALVLLAAVVGAVVGFLTWLRSDRPGARPLTLFLVAASFWAVTEGLGLAAAGLGAVRFWARAGLVLSTVIPLSWLVTVLAYTGTDGWLTRGRLALLLVEPAAFVVLVWTNAGHALVWTDGEVVLAGGLRVFATEPGLAFWGHQAYSYLLVMAGGVLLLRRTFRAGRLYRLQGTALLAAIAVPMIGNALAAFGFVPRGIDPTALGFVVSGVVLALAMFRTDLLRLTPAIRELGREEVLADLEDKVLIVDGDDRIVDANPAAGALLDAPRSGAVGTPLEEALPPLAATLDDDVDKTHLRLQLDGRVRYYDVRISPLYRYRGVLSGRLISLRDVTEQRQREQRLDVLNRLLRHNLRNELNIVRGNVTLARDEADPPVADRLEDALATLDTVLARSEKIGRLSRLFESEADGQFDLATHLAADLADLGREYPDADVTVDLPEGVRVAAGPAVTAVFEELVRNGIEHNDGDRPSVTVTVDEAASDETYVVVRVADDGPGIDHQERRVIAEGRETRLDHGSGLGLWLAQWVVERNGGTLDIEATDDGTVVAVRLPRADADAPDGADTLAGAARGYSAPEDGGRGAEAEAGTGAGPGASTSDREGGHAPGG